MSSRALRRLKGEQRAQADLNAFKLADEDDEGQTKSDKTAHKQKNISNIFELVTSGMRVCQSAEVGLDGITMLL